jgi:DNA-binding transcriptional LysR family regulator
VPFDIRQLRYAIAAADHGSFYRAARALDIEQSTLAGNTFIRGAKPMVATADRLVTMMRAAGQGRAGGLVLGYNSSVSAGNLRATLLGWREAHPDVEVECVEADRSVLLAGLDTGEVDLAILMEAARRAIRGSRRAHSGASGYWRRCRKTMR